jgi:hypothetical protein
MQTSAELQPWFLAYFLIVWAGAISYVATFTVLVVRIRRLNGEAQGSDDWLKVLRDTWTVRYLAWVFSRRYRNLADRLVDRLVAVVRVQFVVLLPATLLMFALLPFSMRPGMQRGRDLGVGRAPVATAPSAGGVVIRPPSARRDDGDVRRDPAAAPASPAGARW